MNVRKEVIKSERFDMYDKEGQEKGKCKMNEKNKKESSFC
jgi:hypothetical protein